MDTHHTPSKDNGQLIPLSIIVAGILVAGAIYFGGSKPSTVAQGVANAQAATAEAVGVIEPVSNKDHIVGNPNAKVIVYEYSDFECPFCKTFHNTMHQIMETYKDGEVAWVYRQFPIAQLHSKAPKESEASECVTELGGNTAFWKFADKLFATTNSNNSLDAAQLPVFAQAAGVDVTAFNNCLASGKYTKVIDDAVVTAGKAGAKGTPYSVAVTKSGKKVAISGAQPFETVKATIDSLLK
jgi:protein-disulfide isomerase